MKYLILILMMSATNSFAGEDEGGGPKVGPGKGVVFFSKEAGFELSPEAVKRMDIKSKQIELKSCNLKTVQVVTALDKKFIFILRDRKYRAAPASCSGLKVSDEGVISGAEFLQVIEMDLSSGESEEKEAGHD